MIHDEFPGKLNTSIPRNQNHMLAGKKMTGNSWKQNCLGSRSLGTEFLSSKYTESGSVTDGQEIQQEKVASLIGIGPKGNLVGLWQRAGLPLQETRPRITIAGIYRENLTSILLNSECCKRLGGRCWLFLEQLLYGIETISWYVMIIFVL